MNEKSKRLLFVCVENAGRSQMAQGFAETLGKGSLDVYSAGSRPSSQVNPMAVEVMKERGVDISGRKPKGLDALPPVEMDYLITMGCEDTCPAVSTKNIIEWQIPDPKGQSLDVVREIRDLIEQKVKSLFKEIV